MPSARAATTGCGITCPRADGPVSATPCQGSVRVAAVSAGDGAAVGRSITRGYPDGVSRLRGTHGHGVPALTRVRPEAVDAGSARRAAFASPDRGECGQEPWVQPSPNAPRRRSVAAVRGRRLRRCPVSVGSPFAKRAAIASPEGATVASSRGCGRGPKDRDKPTVRRPSRSSPTGGEYACEPIKTVQGAGLRRNFFLFTARRLPCGCFQTIAFPEGDSEPCAFRPRHDTS
jgi:hypothetical protein